RFDYRLDHSCRAPILGRLGTGRCQQRDHVRDRISHSPIGIHPRECFLPGRECNQSTRLAPIQILLEAILSEGVPWVHLRVLSGGCFSLRIIPPPADSPQTATVRRPIAPRTGTRPAAPSRPPRPGRTYDCSPSRWFPLPRRKRPPPQPGCSQLAAASKASAFPRSV